MSLVHSVSLSWNPRASSALVQPLVPSSPEKGPLSPASSFLSDAVERPTKRRRVSVDYSSLSEQEDDDDDEEERPLAATRVTRTSGGENRNGGKATQRGGKQKTSMKAKAHTAPANIPPPTAEEREEMRPAKGINGHDPKVKLEDKMDENQLSRLATGVTVDAAGPASAAVRITILLDGWCH